jgi:signal peptidase I
VSLDAQEPAPGRKEYLLPTDGGEISVRGVHYGGKSVAHELIEAVVLSLLIFLLVQSLVQNREVLGQSMEPTLQNNERLFIDRASYFHYDANFLPRLLGQATVPDKEQYVLAGPQRGDIIVFKPPVPSEIDDYIKRVIAVAGEQVEVRAYDGVYVNGHKLAEPYIKDIPDYNWPAPGQSGLVPPGHLFVLGDNRRNSSDSHIWGFLDDNSIVGKAWITYWPRELFGFLPHPVYANVDTTPVAP